MSLRWNPKKSSFGPQGPLLVGRELGRKRCIGQEDALCRDLYSSYLPCNSWDFGRDSSFGYHGGVFNLEFSPDGKILVAACEQKSFITFDPLTHKPIYCVENAHSDCVNCVRFLDSRTFATCSDDTTIGLWDVRNLRQRICCLKGHSNWVKNIEYAQEEGLLVTSGFDGSVYTWNINNYTEEGISHTRVFHSNGLMRMRLNHDASKMVLCTTNGYLMVIHDLDLNHLAQDLAGFKPNMYRLMQLSRTPIPIAVNSTHLFSSSRNRVELINDFPLGNDAEVISSLQIHPQGWCALSRNTSSDDQSEWTCVHDIQDLPPPSKSGKRSRDLDEEKDDDRPKRANFTAPYPATSGLAPEPVLRTGPHLGTSRSLIDDSLSDTDNESEEEYDDYESETPSPVNLTEFERVGFEDNPVSPSFSPSRTPTMEDRVIDVGRYSPGLPRGWINGTNASSAMNGRASPDLVPSVVGTVGSNDSVDYPSPDYGTGARGDVEDEHVGSPDYRPLSRSPPIRSPEDMGLRFGRRIRGLVGPVVQRATSTPASPDPGPDSGLHYYERGAEANDESDPPSSPPLQLLRVRGVVDLNSIPQPPTYAPASPDPGPDSGVLPPHFDRSGLSIPDPLIRRPDSLSRLETEAAESLSALMAAAADGGTAEEREPLITRRAEAPVRSNLSTRGVQVRIRAPLTWGEGPDGRVGFQLRSAADPEPAGREIEVRLPSLEILEALQAIRGRRNRNRDENPPSFRVRTSRGQVRSRRHAQSVDISGASTSAVFVQAASNFAARTMVYQTDPRVSEMVSTIFNRPRRPRPVERSTTYNIHENVPRLTHYREEPNMGRGFIKELCFSTDGRLIASPFGYGVRLLAFNKECSEMSHCMEAWDGSPVKLYELAASVCHTNVVVSTKFSPTHCMLVSGCLNGKVVWHQPIS